MVWEVRAAWFWMKRDGKVVGPYWLVAARDVLDRSTVKCFLSNALAGVPLEVILHVAFSRWVVERTLEDEKDELGLDHFEVRKYPSVLRHLRLTQVSHLFLARQRQRARGEKSGGDDLPGSDGGQFAAGCLAAEPGRSDSAIEEGGPRPPGRSASQRRIASIPFIQLREEQTKNGQADIIPLHPFLVQELNKLAQGMPGTKVFRNLPEGGPCCAI